MFILNYETFKAIIINLLRLINHSIRPRENRANDNNINKIFPNINSTVKNVHSK